MSLLPLGCWQHAQAVGPGSLSLRGSPGSQCGQGTALVLDNTIPPLCVSTLLTSHLSGCLVSRRMKQGTSSGRKHLRRDSPHLRLITTAEVWMGLHVRVGSSDSEPRT